MGVSLKKDRKDHIVLKSLIGWKIKKYENEKIILKENINGK